MKVDLYWISQTATERLAIMPRPRAGDWLEDELNAWHQASVDVVVSLLTPIEIFELALEEEANACQHNQMTYLSYPIEDRQVPTSTRKTIQLADKISDLLDAGQGVAIHCRMGVGRLALIAACVLARRGMAPQTAFELIAQARGREVPDTEEQRKWVIELMNSLASGVYM